jgi:hypothetical protein
VLAKVRERLAVSKHRTPRVHMERFNVKKLIEVEGKQLYCVDISNRFTAIENLDTEVLIELEKLLERTSKFQPKKV